MPQGRSGSPNSPAGLHYRGIWGLEQCATRATSQGVCQDWTQSQVSQFRILSTKRAASEEEPRDVQQGTTQDMRGKGTKGKQEQGGRLGGKRIRNQDQNSEWVRGWRKRKKHLPLSRCSIKRISDVCPQGRMDPEKCQGQANRK